MSLFKEEEDNILEYLILKKKRKSTKIYVLNEKEHLKKKNFYDFISPPL